MCAGTHTTRDPPIRNDVYPVEGSAPTRAQEPREQTESLKKTQRGLAKDALGGLQG